MVTKRVRPAKRKNVFGEQARSIALMWGTRERPSRGPKPGLTLDGILAATIAIADAEGLDAVSMQRVASEVGVTTMALYRYVPGKAELIDLATDAALADPPAIDRLAKNWREKVEAWANALWSGIRRHPWTLQATDRLQLMGPNQLGWLESGLAALEGSGLEGSELVDGFLTVNGHVRSFAQFATKLPRSKQGVSGEVWTTAIETLLRTHGERFPAIKAAIGAGGFGAREKGLAFGLARVLDGIAAHVARRKRAG